MTPDGPADDAGPLDTGEDDRRLLAEHVAGDPEAFGVLFSRHRDRLWAVALRTTGDPEVAADALQDAMVSAFRRAETFRGDARVTTWLHRVVVNACLDRLRRARVRAAEPLPDDLDPSSASGTLSARAAPTPVAGMGHAPDDPAASAERHDLQRRVRSALGELPPDQRAALVLVDLEGLSVEDAAEVLECPPGTVKSRCSRGRARLATLLADLRDDAEDRTRGDPPDTHSRGTSTAPHPSDRHQAPTSEEMIQP